MAEFKLISEIISRSVADQWEEAKQEWTLKQIYMADEPETCLCGHYPIIECCILGNNQNQNSAMVGNCCVKKFMKELGSNIIFQGVKRISKDNSKAPNEALAEYAMRQNWVSDWEYVFLLDTCSKRKLSPKQESKRSEINQRILKNMRKAGSQA